MSVFGFFLVCIFQQSGLTTERYSVSLLSVFCQNAGKCGPGKFRIRILFMQCSWHDLDIQTLQKYHKHIYDNAWVEIELDNYLTVYVWNMVKVNLLKLAPKKIPLLHHQSVANIIKNCFPCTLHVVLIVLCFVNNMEHFHRS